MELKEILTRLHVWFLDLSVELGITWTETAAFFTPIRGSMA